MRTKFYKAIEDLRRQVVAGRSTRPSREFLAYQLTQRAIGQSEVAKRFLLLNGNASESVPLEASLRWYLGPEMYESIETISELPRTIPKDVRVIVAEPSLAQLVRLGPSASRVRIMGPRYYRHVEVWTGCTTLWRDLLSANDRDRLRRLGHERYSSLIAELGGSASALVFTTGPSIDSVDVEELASGHQVRIGCNSVVSNPGMLEELQPNVFAFGDGAFHFGPSKYAAQFREDLCRFLETQSPWVLTSIEMFPLLERELPSELLTRFVPIELARRAPDSPLETPTHLRNGNVMTTFMLPLASHLADKVTFAGCDGRSPEDHGFWSHSSSAQYDELYQTVIDAHPSFFDDADYVAYYERHCSVLEREIGQLLGNGTELRMATPSYIPSLQSLPGGSV